MFVLLKNLKYTIFLQVELAHGGRGQSSSGDRRSDYGGGRGRGGGGSGRYGISKHSDYRGAT